MQCFKTCLMWMRQRYLFIVGSKLGTNISFVFSRLDTISSRLFYFIFKNFLLEDIGALQWKLEPPLEGEEKDEVEISEMLSEIDSFAQRIEDLAVEVKNHNSFAQNENSFRP